MRKASFVLVTVIALIFVISTIPSVRADSNITLVQNNVGSGQSNTQAQCVYSSNVVKGNSLLVTLDAVNINNPVTSITDTLGNTFTSLIFTMNSASTWVQSWEAESIATGGTDTITIAYTSASNGSNAVTCDEYVGDVAFTGVSTLGSGGALLNCNTCTLNLTATTHKINVIHGYADSSQTPPFGGIAYAFLGGINPKAGSGTSQAISGSSNSILIYHAEIDVPVSVVADSAMVVTCSPACNESPMFVHAFWATCTGFCSTTTLLTTQTVTAWNTIDPATPINWITLALFLFLIPCLMWGALIAFNTKPSTTVFTTLIACFIGSILGVISGIDLGVNAIVPLGVAVFNGISLGIYIVISRQRGSGGN